MAENEHGIFRIASNLAGACLISGLVIGAVWYVTAPVAAEKAEAMKQESMRSLVADAESFEEIEGEAGCFAARQGGKTVAYIVPAESKGYGGRIKLLVAVTAEGQVIDFSILEHNETPGLGDNAKKPEFRQQFAGKRADKLEVTKDKANTENIQAMTGATISSRAVTLGVKQAAEKAAALAKGGK